MYDTDQAEQLVEEARDAADEFVLEASMFWGLVDEEQRAPQQSSVGVPEPLRLLQFVFRQFEARSFYNPVFNAYDEKFPEREIPGRLKALLKLFMPPFIDAIGSAEELTTVHTALEQNLCLIKANTHGRPDLRLYLAAFIMLVQRELIKQRKSNPHLIKLLAEPVD